MQHPFRVLTLRFNCPVCHGALSNLATEIPFAFCASLASQHWTHPSLPQEDQPKFFSVDVRQGVYNEIDLSKMIPLDEDLITKMRDCEALFMYMMIRHESSRIVPYIQRKQLYITHLTFWNDFLERNRINLLLSSTLPHEMPDHIIYALCKLKNIPVIFSHAAPIKDTSFLQYDIEESVVSIKKRLEEIEQENPDEVQLSEQLEEYFNKQTKPVGTLSVIYPEKPRGIIAQFGKQILSATGAFIHWVPTLFSVRDWYRRLLKVHSAYRQYMLCRFYDMHASTPDMQATFIYYPLQYQPECSTCPMAGAFVDQDVSIHMLSRAVPDNVLIYVKEHPRQRTQGTAGRNIDLYKKLLAMPNVKLIAHESSTFDLREHCCAVATGTGTAGLEALFREKPVFLFGHTFYQYADGVHIIRTNKDCVAATKAVFEEGKKPTLKSVRRFLKAVDDTRMHLAIGGWYLEISDKTIEESTQVFTDALRSELQKLQQ